MQLIKLHFSQDMEDKFDAPLLGILQNCGELEPFLEVVLGFLYRKTDFFRPLSSDQSMGFPPGVAREKLLKVCNIYLTFYLHN